MAQEHRQKLATGLCFYEKSLASIKRCVESIKDYVDVILAIDGRFDNFPDSQILSSPEVREYLQSIQNVVLVDYPGSEVAKRQKYCSLCLEYQCDYLLIIDSDEYVMPNSKWEEFKNNLRNCENTSNIYGIRFAYAAPVHMDTTPYPRLWYKPYEVQYIKHNLWQTSLQGQVSSTSGHELIEGIIMAGDDNLHTPKYIDQGRDYQRHLIRQENPVEKTWDELFAEADLKGKLALFHKFGGSGSSRMNDLLDAIIEKIY